ncbi:MAG: SPL family radical SAM protein [Nitrospirota bacterium]
MTGIASLKITEITSRTILSKSMVSDYAVNPYVGCEHACVYCYAKFMQRFTGHKEDWGTFVDVKVNAAELLAREVKKKKPGRVWISGVCDPYQPLERKYRLTRRCLEVLVENNWPITVQTKSPLVLRDINILKRAADVEVGFTITTADERMRKIFEPGAPPIAKRIDALRTLHDEGIKTFAMIAPVLPGAEKLPELLGKNADHVLVDRLNYHYADAVYRKFGMQWARDDDFFRNMGEDLWKAFEKNSVPCQVLF